MTEIELKGQVIAVRTFLTVKNELLRDAPGITSHIDRQLMENLSGELEKFVTREVLNTDMDFRREETTYHARLLVVDNRPGVFINSPISLIRDMCLYLSNSQEEADNLFNTLSTLFKALYVDGVNYDG